MASKMKKAQPDNDRSAGVEGRYSGVSEFLASTLDEGDSFVEEFNERLESRDVVKTLQTMRAAKGMSQAELAEQLGCTQGRVSKLETGLDEDLKLRDIEGYAKALGRDAHLVFSKHNETSLERIDRFAVAIRDELKMLGRGDPAADDLLKDVAESFMDVLANQVHLLQVAIEKSSRKERSSGTPRHIHVEAVVESREVASTNP